MVDASFTWHLLVNILVLVENELVVDTSVKYALKHHDISNNLTCHKSILHFFIWNEVIEPVLTELGDATHLEEVRRLHVSSDVVGSLADLALAHGAVLIQSSLVSQVDLTSLSVLGMAVNAAVGADLTRGILLCLLESMSSLLALSHGSGARGSISVDVWGYIHYI